MCQLDCVLYPVDVVRWCVYALYIQDEARIRRDCRYDITKVEQNLAKSLGGYLWAISAVATETLQIPLSARNKCGAYSATVTDSICGRRMRRV